MSAKVSANHVCPYCGDAVAPERVALGKPYCMKRECIAQGDTFKRDFRLVLQPKVGFTWVRADDPLLQTLGRSSGRTT
jgi:ribosomal protein L37AE/L43A